MTKNAEGSLECDVSLSASPSTKLPDLNVKFYNEHHSALEIRGLLDEPLQFSTLAIEGSSGVVRLNHTSIAKALTIHLEYGFLYLNNLILPTSTLFDLQLAKGLIDIELHPSMTPQFFNVSHPYGAICLSGGGVNGYRSSEDCPS